MKKKILIFKGFYYPNDSPGALRNRCFARYLAKLGHIVHLYAIEDSRYGNTPDVVREAMDGGVDLRLLKLNPIERCIEVWSRRFAARFPSKHQGLGLISTLLARQVLCQFRRGDIDVILASYPFAGSLPIIVKLSRKFGIPLILDFRDLVDELDPNHTGWKTKRLFSLLLPYIRESSFCITVSKPLVDALKDRYRVGRVYEITNGYDGILPLFDGNSRISMDKFTMLYPGSLAYGRNRDLKLLFEALDNLALNSGVDLDNIKVVILGTHALGAFDCIMGCRSRSCLALEGSLPRADVLALESKSSVLLSIASPGCVGILTSKVFEYLKAGRPILSFPKDNDVLDSFIKNTGVGFVCDSPDEIAMSILPLYKEWCATGSLSPVNVNRSFVEQFSRERQTEILSGLIELL